MVKISNTHKSNPLWAECSVVLFMLLVPCLVGFCMIALIDPPSVAVVRCGGGSGSGSGSSSPMAAIIEHCDLYPASMGSMNGSCRIATTCYGNDDCLQCNAFSADGPTVRLCFAGMSGACAKPKTPFSV